MGFSGDFQPLYEYAQANTNGHRPDWWGFPAPPRTLLGLIQLVEITGPDVARKVRNAGLATNVTIRSYFPFQPVTRDYAQGRLIVGEEMQCFTKQEGWQLTCEPAVNESKLKTGVALDTRGKVRVFQGIPITEAEWVTGHFTLVAEGRPDALRNTIVKAEAAQLDEIRACLGGVTLPTVLYNLAELAVNSELILTNNT